ncbi:MAG: hypothetical protein L0H31_08385 [Nocardioidaceae bacterium]|nr:hypothetical protein [Nocardioidaceae bacterium]
MNGDTSVIRRRVLALRDQSADIRALADQLVARVESLAWNGRAAEAMATRVSDRAAHLRGVAERHHTAGDALAEHAGAVDIAAEEIAQIQTRVEAMIADARVRVDEVATANRSAHGSSITPDARDVRLLAFQAPPRGHRAWLDIDIPGLER